MSEWVRKAEIDSGVVAGVPSDVAEKLKALERENRELWQANEILRKASAYFAQAEFDRPLKGIVRANSDWIRSNPGKLSGCGHCQSKSDVVAVGLRDA